MINLQFKFVSNEKDFASLIKGSVVNNPLSFEKLICEKYETVHILVYLHSQSPALLIFNLL